jgi:DNA-binding NarL/FixJ family response regulator
MWPDAICHFESAARDLRGGGADWPLLSSYLDQAEMRDARGRRGDATRAAALRAEAEAMLQSLGQTLDPPPRRASWSARFGLTSRELEILGQVADGRRNQEIAEALTLSHRTIERHLENIFAKMGVDSRTEAVVKAVRGGLLNTGQA